MSEPVVLIASIVLCLLGNGFFSGSEIAVISARRSMVEARIAEGSRAARRLKHLHDHLDDFLATVQIGVTLMGTLAGVLGGYLAKLFIEPVFASSDVARWISPTLAATFIAGGGIVLFELVLGELVPKALALRFTEPAALLVAPILDLMARWSRWLVVGLTGATRGILRLFRIPMDTGHHAFISTEEIRHLVAEGRQQGVIDDTEMEIIHSVIQFSETPVKKVMVPRPKIFALDIDTAPGEVERLIVEAGFSRIPVYEGSVDNMVGLIFVKDVLRLLEKRQPVVLRKIRHPVHLVPETKQVGELLKELQKRRTHMSLVIDEHGSVTGLVTLEDLLEEIVGEIHDEYDWEERPIERLRDGSLVVDGTVSAAELRDRHEIPIPESDEFETVAGFMLDALGSVPRGGEVVALGDHRLTVVDVEKNRISKVKIDSPRGLATPAAPAANKAKDPTAAR